MNRTVSSPLWRRRLVLSFHLLVSACWFSTAQTQSPGRVVVWGDNTLRQGIIPEAATNVVAVAAGANHNLALRSDGSVIAWGDNRNGQTNVPAAATNVIAIAASTANSLALRNDGVVVGWGYSGLVPRNLTNIVAIAAGEFHGLALTRNGRVLRWRDGSGSYPRDAFPLVTNGMTAIAAGLYKTNDGSHYTLAVNADGSVFCSKADMPGSWGVGGQPFPALANAPTPPVAVARGLSQTFGLYPDGRVRVSGRGPTIGSSLTNVASLSVFRTNLLALRSDGLIEARGRSEITGIPGEVSDVVAVSVGEAHGIALLGDGGPRILGSIRYRSLASVGESLPLSVQAVGAAPMAYQWLVNGQPVAGANSRLPSIPATWGGDTNEYQVIASNSFGAVTSSVARVTVTGLHAWGSNFDHQLQIPEGLRDVVSLGVGGAHTVAVKQDGSVVQWGRQSRKIDTNAIPIIPVKATNVISVAAGGEHSLALRADGTVLDWAYGVYGHSNAPPGLSNVVSVHAGWMHSLVLKRDGSVQAWGNNDFGQCNVPPEATNLIDVAAGYYQTVGLRADRTLVAWGWEPDVPPDATNIVSVSVGWGHTLAARTDGHVIAWGEPSYGQSDVPESATNIIAVAAGFYHSLALRDDGTVLAWGKGFHGVTTIPKGMSDVSAIFAGEDFNLAVSRPGPPQLGAITGQTNCQVGDQTILAASIAGSYPFQFQWLRDGVSIPGETGRFLSLRGVAASEAGAYSLRVSNALGSAESLPVQLTVGPAPRIANRLARNVTRPGQPFCLQAEVLGQPPLSLQWLLNGEPLADGPGLSGARGSVLCLESPGLGQSGLFSLSVSNAFGTVTGPVAMVSVTPIVAWGNNSEQQIAIPPTMLAPLAVAAGDNHSLALLEDGSVMAWGDNASGQCNVPVLRAKALAIAAGEAHSVALLEDGSLQAWGDNSKGQITIPSNLTNVVAIAAGGNGTVVKRADGQVIAWGEGLLGAQSGPMEASNVVAIAAGPGRLLALRTDGAVVQWGAVVDLPPFSNITAISAGRLHNLALTTDGHVVAWGSGWLGQLTVPEGATNVVAVSAGGDGSLALRRDGTPIAWGDPDFGQLDVPSATTNTVAIAKGGLHSLALQSPWVPQRPLPSLQVQHNQRWLSLSWPASVTGFGLEYTPAIDPASWEPVTLAPTLEGGMHSVTVLPSGETGFYRLRKIIP